MAAFKILPKQKTQKKKREKKNEPVKKGLNAIFTKPSPYSNSKITSYFKVIVNILMTKNPQTFFFAVAFLPLSPQINYGKLIYQFSRRYREAGGTEKSFVQLWVRVSVAHPNPYFDFTWTFSSSFFFSWGKFQWILTYLLFILVFLVWRGREGGGCSMQYLWYLLQ